MEKNFCLPEPIIDDKESASLDKLTERYKKLIAPSKASKVAKKVGEKIPQKIKDVGAVIGETISEQELYKQTLELISSCFKTLEEQVSKYTISSKMIVNSVSKCSKDVDISTIDEICLVRSYDIARAVNSSKGRNRFSALVEGGATGAFGFWGLPFNLAFSMLLYFRAVQTIAMYYGYDVKNNDEELVIAGEVFTNALSPSQKDANEVGGMISKVMAMSQASVVRQTAKKTWADMAARGGVPLVLTQMRALANRAAQKALEKAGRKGLENSLFKSAFEQVGRKLTLKAVGKAVPFVSGAIGAVIDYGQMNIVVRYADIFYQKRFILEKGERINNLFGSMGEPVVIDVNVD